MTDLTHLPDAYRRHLAAITGGSEEQLNDVWEPDGVLEFPYARALGRTSRLDGIDAIGDYFTGLAMFSDFSFDNWRVMSDHTGMEWVVEVHGSAVLTSGEPYEQDYITRISISQRGRIAWMREYWDPTRF